MKTFNKSVAIVALSALFFSVTSCSNNRKNAQNNYNPSQYATAAADITKANNSRSAMNYDGVYEGTIPCADCSGIRTELTIKGNEYTLKTEYLGKSDDNTFTESGICTWNNAGTIITLDYDPMNQYQVEDNVLFVLNQYGNRITGDLADMYILRKR